MSENGKWQLGFWVITSLAGVWLLALTQGVIANDRLRSCEDQRIQDRVEMYQREIIQRLVRIESKMEIR